MPRYDYRCEGGHQYELQQPFGSPTEHPCEKCGKRAQRQIHAGAVVFKGAGWYKTDSRSSGGSSSRRPSGSSASGTSSDADSGADAGGSSKPAADGAKQAGQAKRAEKSAELSAKADS